MRGEVEDEGGERWRASEGGGRRKMYILCMAVK